MSNEQQPRDDDQADEPTVAQDNRTSAERVADEMNRRGVPTPNSGMATTAERLAAHMRELYNLYEQFETERRAEIIAAGGDPDEPEVDPLSREWLVNIARDHRAATRPGADDKLSDELIEYIADTVSLSDVRVMRGAWAAITDAMPQIAYVARMKNGKTADEIAQATGYTSSRVAQLIRQEKQRIAEAGLTRRYSWRVDVMDLTGTWHDREHGEGDLDPDNLPGEADRLIDEAGARIGRARIFLWEGSEGADGDAAHTLDRTKSY